MLAQQEAVRAFLDGKPAGRSFAPYDFFLAVRGLHRFLGGDEERNRDLWNRLAYKLLFLQNPDGTWGNPRHSMVIHASSTAQMGLKLDEQRHRRRQPRLKPEERSEYKPRAWWNGFDWYHQREHVSPLMINTAMALLFLNDGVRAPAAGYVLNAGAPRTPPPVMNKVLELLQTRDKLDVTHMVIDPAAAAINLSGVPVVFLTGDADLNNSALVRELRRYCDNGGTIVAEIAGSAQAAAMQPQLQSLVEGGKVITVPESAPVFSSFMGPKPRLNAISNSKGRPAVYIIPLDAIPASPAVQTAYLLVKDNVPDGFFDADYASKPGADEGAALRIQALPQLKPGAFARTAGETAAPAPRAAGEPAAPDAPATTQPAAPAETSGPRTDEVW